MVRREFLKTLGLTGVLSLFPVNGFTKDKLSNKKFTFKYSISAQKGEVIQGKRLTKDIVSKKIAEIYDKDLVKVARLNKKRELKNKINFS